MRGQGGAKADRAGFTEKVQKIWGGRKEGRRRGTVMDSNKSLDAGMGQVSSQPMEKPVGPEHRMAGGAQDSGGRGTEAAELGRARLGLSF